jgi:hypothetical protein
MSQANFPIFFKATDSGFRNIANGGHVRSTSGYDIRPYSDAALKNPLPFELERYDPGTGEVDMWINVPLVSSVVDTVIYLGYGNAALTTDGSSPAAWDNGYKGVWHLDVNNGQVAPLPSSATATDLQTQRNDAPGVASVCA